MQKLSRRGGGEEKKDLSTPNKEKIQDFLECEDGESFTQFLTLENQIYFRMKLVRSLPLS